MPPIQIVIPLRREEAPEKVEGRLVREESSYADQRPHTAGPGWALRWRAPARPLHGKRLPGPQTASLRAVEEGEQGERLLTHLKIWGSKHAFSLPKKSSEAPARRQFDKSSIFLESLILSPRKAI